jgi:hypothetical protein
MSDKCTVHNIGRKIKKFFAAPKSFSRKQWACIAIIGLAILAYLGYRRDQAIKDGMVREKKENGGIAGCYEAVKRRNGTFKCVECEDGYRMSKGKCVKHTD